MRPACVGNPEHPVSLCIQHHEARDKCGRSLAPHGSGARIGKHSSADPGPVVFGRWMVPCRSKVNFHTNKAHGVMSVGCYELDAIAGTFIHLLLSTFIPVGGEENPS